MLKAYYYLTKPGIIYGNILTLIAGYLYGSKWQIDYQVLIFSLLGTSLIIGAAGVFNNLTDQTIDQNMQRTKNRANYLKIIGKEKALVYGAVLTIAGIILLAVFVNLLVLAIGLSALFIYLVPYAFFKRRSRFGTHIGSLAGAAPILAGYTAAVHKLDLTSLILVLILISWQLAHFYAIAIYRYQDYKTAKLPMTPVIKGIKFTKKAILVYIILFAISNLLLSINNHFNIYYLVGNLLISLYWISSYYAKQIDDNFWARQVFLTSLKVILLTSLILSTTYI